MSAFKDTATCLENQVGTGGREGPRVSPAGLRPVLLAEEGPADHTCAPTGPCLTAVLASGATPTQALSVFGISREGHGDGWAVGVFLGSEKGSSMLGFVNQPPSCRLGALLMWVGPHGVALG